MMKHSKALDMITILSQILFLILILVNSCVNGTGRNGIINNKNFASPAGTCEVTIDDCGYTISLLPSNQCQKSVEGQGHPLKWPRSRARSYSTSRSRRSAPDQEYGEGVGTTTIAKELNSLRNDYDRLENKLTKEMRDLSKRVLRGTRRIESMLGNHGNSGGGSKRHGNRNGETRSSGFCPIGFVSIDNWPSCYMFSRFNTTWFDAIDMCNALDSHLVALEEVNEHFVVTFLIRNNPDLQQAEGWWTSGSFLTKTKQWVWKTHNEIRPFSYIKWASNEPNEEHNQNLLGMMLYTVDRYLWHDQIFTDKYNFICEK